MRLNNKLQNNLIKSIKRANRTNYTSHNHIVTRQYSVNMIYLHRGLN